jgi:hypothetical protein
MIDFSGVEVRNTSLVEAYLRDFPVFFAVSGNFLQIARHTFACFARTTADMARWGCRDEGRYQ